MQTPTPSTRSTRKISTRLAIPSLSLIVLAWSLSFGGTPALAGPLTAFGDHTGEDHSFDNHRNSYLEGIILDGALLRSTHFLNANLVDSFLRSAILDGADLRNADLTGADLTGASMLGLRALNADFTNATLDGVSFATGDIRNATFVGARLLGADLSSLAGANRADFTGAFFDASTILAPGIDTSMMTFVPEPSSAVLLLLGLMGLEIYGRRFARRT